MPDVERENGHGPFLGDQTTRLAASMERLHEPLRVLAVVQAFQALYPDDERAKLLREYRKLWSEDRRCHLELENAKADQAMPEAERDAAGREFKKAVHELDAFLSAHREFCAAYEFLMGAIPTKEIGLDRLEE